MVNASKPGGTGPRESKNGFRKEVAFGWSSEDWADFQHVGTRERAFRRRERHRLRGGGRRAWAYVGSSRSGALQGQMRAQRRDSEREGWGGQVGRAFHATLRDWDLKKKIQQTNCIDEMEYSVASVAKARRGTRLKLLPPGIPPSGFQFSEPKKS